MDLALLVYGISLLTGINGFLFALTFVSGIVFLLSSMYNASWRFQGGEYSWNCNKDGTLKDGVIQARAFGVKAWKYSAICAIVCMVIAIFVPSEKTAYVMVGAYATQKVAENEKVQETGQKVLTIINQKLDSYVEEGIKKATETATKEKK